MFEYPESKRLSRRTFLSCVTAVTGASFLSHSAMGSLLTTQQTRELDYSKVINSIRQNLPQSMAANHVRSVAVSLIDGQRLVWAGGFGVTDIAKTKPVTSDTLFSLQSISKTYTATAFLMAVERGWFKLDDPVNKQ